MFYVWDDLISNGLDLYLKCLVIIGWTVYRPLEDGLAGVGYRLGTELVDHYATRLVVPLVRVGSEESALVRHLSIVQGESGTK